MHRYVCMFVCLCVYIMQPLTAIGGGGGPIGVFALAAVQHSTFLCDIQYCDLRKPTQQRSALSLSLPPSDCSLSFLPPPHISVYLSLSPFLSIIYSTLFISYVDMENHLSIPSLSLTVTLPFFFCQRSLDEAAFSQLQILAAVNENTVYNTSLCPSPRYIITTCISPVFKQQEHY